MFILLIISFLPVAMKKIPRLNVLQTLFSFRFLSLKPKCQMSGRIGGVAVHSWSCQLMPGDPSHCL